MDEQTFVISTRDQLVPSWLVLVLDWEQAKTFIVIDVLSTYGTYRNLEDFFPQNKTFI